MSVALTKAQELGFKVAACASTGNLANSVAAHAAQAGMESVVFIPADLEAGKVVTTAVFGGRLIAVDGTTTTSTGCAPSWPRSAPRGRSSTSTSAPTTPKVPRPWLSRWPSSSAGRRPDHVVVPVASGAS